MTKPKLDQDLSGGFKANIFLLYPPWKENDPKSNNLSIRHSYTASEFELHVSETVVQDIYKVSFCAQNEKSYKSPELKINNCSISKPVQPSELQTATFILKQKFCLHFVSILQTTLLSHKAQNFINWFWWQLCSYYAFLNNLSPCHQSIHNW